MELTCDGAVQGNLKIARHDKEMTIHTIYFGCSQTLSAREVMGCFDVRPEGMV